MAGLFQVLKGNKDGTFAKPVVLNGTDDQPLIIPIESREQQTENICTRPTAVDWDSDGDLDLVVGNFSGTFYLFKGEGEGKFQPKPEQIMAGEEPLKIDAAHSDPFVVDWDADGDLDLISGTSNGGVYWAENSAGKGKTPALKSFQELIAAGPRIDYGTLLDEADLKAPVSATRVWVDDVNDDGKLDVLVGDNVTLASPAEGLSTEEFKERQAQWQKDFDAALRATEAAGEDAEARTKANTKLIELYQSREKFLREDRTGFVWLYVQK
jgi:hypothetical protein